MLNVWVERRGRSCPEKYLYGFSPMSEFSDAVKVEWIEHDFFKKIVREIDKSEVTFGGYIQSPFLGKIPVDGISGGAKALAMFAFYQPDGVPELIIRSTKLGTNCFTLLDEAVKVRRELGLADATMVQAHYFIPQWEEPIDARIIQTGVLVSTWREYFSEVFKLDVER